METLILTPLSDLLISDADGFEQNITVEERQRDTCSNVTGNGVAGDAVMFFELHTMRCMGKLRKKP